MDPDPDDIYEATGGPDIPRPLSHMETVEAEARTAMAGIAERYGLLG